jgi:hypothetical protein
MSLDNLLRQGGFYKFKNIDSFRNSKQFENNYDYVFQIFGKYIAYEDKKEKGKYNLYINDDVFYHTSFLEFVYLPEKKSFYLEDPIFKRNSNKGNNNYELLKYKSFKFNKDL